MAARYDPLSPNWRKDPYPFYAELREEDPVHWSEDQQAWVVTRFNDVDDILLDTTRFSITGETYESHEHLYKGRPPFRAMVSIDGPDHNRIRAIVQPFFTHKSMTNLEARSREVANALIDRVQATGRIDPVEDLVVPMISALLSDMTGLDESMGDTFAYWGEVFVLLESGLAGPTEREAHRKADEELRELLAERRGSQGEDLISVLSRAVDTGELTEWEAIDSAFNLLGAPWGATKGLMGNAMMALLSNPDQYQKVMEDRSLVASMVEEALRFDNSSQTLFRTATCDVELDGSVIRKGQLVHTYIGAANRDPQHFPDPDSFDVQRQRNDHLGFGAGIHRCIGLHFARMVVNIAFETLLNRLSGIRLDPEGKPERFFVPYILWGYDSVPLCFDVK